MPCISSTSVPSRYFVQSADLGQSNGPGGAAQAQGVLGLLRCIHMRKVQDFAASGNVTNLACTNIGSPRPIRLDCVGFLEGGTDKRLEAGTRSCNCIDRSNNHRKRGTIAMQCGLYWGNDKGLCRHIIAPPFDQSPEVQCKQCEVPIYQEGWSRVRWKSEMEWNGPKKAEWMCGREGMVGSGAKLVCDFFHRATTMQAPTGAQWSVCNSPRRVRQGKAPLNPKC